MGEDELREQVQVMEGLCHCAGSQLGAGSNMGVFEHHLRFLDRNLCVHYPQLAARCLHVPLVCGSELEVSI